MATVKHHRESKRQLGQFFTPSSIAEKLVSRLSLRADMRVLEPGFGAGAFLFPLIEAFLELRGGDLAAVLRENVWGIEIDPGVHAATLSEIQRRWGALPADHHLLQGDYLDPNVFAEQAGASGDLLGEAGGFDLVIGNPPFGGTIALELQDALERRYGRRHGCKIKRESYSLFIVKSLDLLADGGKLEFICSDTFLTIPTMRGLRHALMVEGETEVVRLREFSEETNYPMVVLHHFRGGRTGEVKVDGSQVCASAIRSTGNLSWQVTQEHSGLFNGPLLSEFIVASSGMTTGKNEFFVRELDADGAFEEPYAFDFYDDPITLARELQRARLGKLSAKKKEQIASLERAGAVRRNLRVTSNAAPARIHLPHPHYRYYNKAQAGAFYTPPRFAIYWKDGGDAVRTFKKNGNWYLHGVGGAPFFEREGLTWRLVSARLDMRYLPPGYILDSGAPCAFLRPGVDDDELWFILGWCASPFATEVLKSVINHTMNIQSKDVERLPYPWWVQPDEKLLAIEWTRDIVRAMQAGEQPSEQQLSRLSLLYRYEAGRAKQAA